MDIEEAIWGFNNQRPTGQCIPLSLLLSNNTPESFDELVQLNRLQFNGTKVGAPLYRRVFLAPYTSQWVQFYPYIINNEQQENWSLSWGPGNLYSRRINKPGRNSDNTENEAANKSRIILVDRNALSQGGSHFKTFLDELFPPSVTATDSLDEIILDHVPRWDAARRNSFMDWLYRGGILHLLPDASDANLKFTTNMSALNAPFDHFRIGAGLIIRHSGQLKELDKKQLLSRKQEVQSAELSAVGATVPTPETTKKAPKTYNNGVIDNFNSYLLYQLSELTHPDHNWSMIYLMTGAYLLMIFPGCYFFHKKQKGYRNSLLFILMTVALFSTMFWSVGKRGYGETTTLNSLIIARPLSGDHYDLTYCVNAFVTDGADYQFTGKGEGAIYTTAQEIEKVKGAIMNGVDGSFHADIPPFSARSFMCRIKATYPKPVMKVLEYQIDKKSRLKTLKIKLNSALPKNTSISQVLYNRVLYDLKQTREKDAFILELGNHSTPLTAWKSILESDSRYNRRFGYRDEETDTPKVYASLYKRLVMKNLNLVRPGQLRTYNNDLSRIKLFFYCDIPDEFKLKTNVNGLQQGRTLFVNKIALLNNMND
ncbi:MAG: hypothetical protein K0U86_22980 [Planctomycetes bacterium]|nr:hypothetical protein [Planctomycetota bacterium]MCH9776370.1 hypothetical protein [Planctomycetota bacterium]